MAQAETRAWACFGVNFRRSLACRGREEKLQSSPARMGVGATNGLAAVVVVARGARVGATAIGDGCFGSMPDNAVLTFRQSVPLSVQTERRVDHAPGDVV